MSLAVSVARLGLISRPIWQHCFWEMDVLYNFFDNLKRGVASIRKWTYMDKSGEDLSHYQLGSQGGSALKSKCSR